MKRRRKDGLPRASLARFAHNLLEMDASQTATFPGRFDSLAAISEFTRRAAEAAGFDDAAIYQVQLAADEACTNIIEHAYGGEGLGEIECTIQIESTGLTLTFRDKGRPFDPTCVPQPNIRAALEDRESGGLGVFLIHRLMDEVHFDCADSGNALTLVKRKEPAA